MPTTMRTRILAAVLAVIVGVLGVWAFTAYTNAIYFKGASHAVQAVNAAADAAEAEAAGHMRAGDHHGSPALAANGRDVHTMNPFDHKMCDRTLNGARATGISYKASTDEARLVTTKGFRDCNHNNLPFKGGYHQACNGNLYSCGKISFHRKAKRRARRNRAVAA